MSDSTVTEFVPLSDDEFEDKLQEALREMRDQMLLSDDPKMVALAKAFILTEPTPHD